MTSHNHFELMIRTQEGDATPSEREALQEWLEASVENRKLFAEFEKFRRTALAQKPQSKPDVETAWRHVENRIRTDGSQPVFAFRLQQPTLSTLFSQWNWRLAGAVILFLIAAFYGSYRWSLPQNYTLAVLNEWDERNLALETRSEQPALQTESTRAADALLSAGQKRLGIFPYFNAQRVAAAVAHLQNAFTETADPVSRNKYAYYLAKAHLMQENVAAARERLNTVLASEAVAYRDEAKSLLERLE